MVSTSGNIGAWNIYRRTEGTLLGEGRGEGVDQIHLPRKGSLPKVSGCPERVWCCDSWDECC